MTSGDNAGILISGYGSHDKPISVNQDNVGKPCYYPDMRITEPYRIYNPRSLGQAVRHFRKEAGLTQAELAAKVGMRQSHLSELESGKTTEQTERLLALFKALDARIVVAKADW